MTGTPVFSVHPDREADVFDARQQAGQAAATTGGRSVTLADWKGERSRRVPGEGEPNGVRRTSEDDRRESSGTSTGRSEATEERSEPRGRPAGGRGMSERQRREPRAHESARASEVSSSSTDHRTSSFQS